MSSELLCKQINYSSHFNEFILLEIECEENTELTVGVFYRSPSCNVDNDLKLFDLVNSLCTAKV